MKPPTERLSPQKILRFWLPLEATWLMMAVEAPFLAAVIARLPDPKHNLAAFGVANALAWMMESPIIMILSAANALVRDRLAFFKLRRFTYIFLAAVTAAMLVLVFPPVFNLVVQGLIGLSRETTRLAAGALLLLIPWPAAIGFRRFYQGILIRHGKPKAVAVGTVVRLSAMGIMGSVLALATKLPGAVTGGAALSAGVTAEAAASWIMARRTVRCIMTQRDEECVYGRNLTASAIGRFYMPLAMTSFLSVAVHPMLSFFLGRSRFPLESLAVLPVLNALAFIFRSAGIACQEIVIALVGDRGENLRPVKKFVGKVGFAASALLAVIAFTPLSGVWLHRLSGLSQELTDFALLPARLLVLLPLVEALIAFQRGLLVRAHRTWPIVSSTGVQMAVVLAVLWLTVSPLNVVGAIAAGIALEAGYFAGFAVLRRPVRGIRFDDLGTANGLVVQPLADTMPDA